jgi:hypothetical protein
LVADGLDGIRDELGANMENVAVMAECSGSTRAFPSPAGATSVGRATATAVRVDARFDHLDPTCL